MKKSTAHVARAIVAITVISTGAGLHAQSNAGREDESDIIVTGCLQPAGTDRAAVATSGSAAGANAGASSTGGAAADSRAFMLVNARVGAAPGGGSGLTTVAPAGSGTTESAARAGSTPPSPAITGATDRNGNSTGSTATYALRGDSPDLPRHAGQEVEISGRLIPVTGATGAAGAQGSTASATSTSGSSTANAADRARQLEVRTIRMIASVCAAR